MAIKLATSIQTVQRINCTSKVSTWSRSFALLHTLDKVEVRRIKEALLWYCSALPQRHGDKYFLVVLSGPTFRDKFPKIEAAMQRDAQTADGGGSADSTSDGDGPPVARVRGTVVGPVVHLTTQEALDAAGADDEVEDREWEAERERARKQKR